MIKHHHETCAVDVTVIDDVLCNKCGKSCFLGFVDAEDAPHINGVTLKVHWGYHSKKEGTRTLSHVCEACHDEFAASFSIPQVVIETL
jgi:hypothetical protein